MAGSHASYRNVTAFSFLEREKGSETGIRNGGRSRGHANHSAGFQEPRPRRHAPPGDAEQHGVGQLGGNGTRLSIAGVTRRCAPRAGLPALLNVRTSSFPSPTIRLGSQRSSGSAGPARTTRRGTGTGLNGDRREPRAGGRRGDGAAAQRPSRYGRLLPRAREAHGQLADLHAVHWGMLADRRRVAERSHGTTSRHSHSKLSGSGGLSPRSSRVRPRGPTSAARVLDRAEWLGKVDGPRCLWVCCRLFAGRRRSRV